MLLFLYLFLFLSNNKIGGDFINKRQLNFFWKVGKFTVEKKYMCENIIFMKKFYLYFPIFIDNMNDLDWDSYRELLKLNNKKVCYFYYYLSLFCNFKYTDLRSVIENKIYYRI